MINILNLHTLIMTWRFVCNILVFSAVSKYRYEGTHSNRMTILDAKVKEEPEDENSLSRPLSRSILVSGNRTFVQIWIWPGSDQKRLGLWNWQGVHMRSAVLVLFLLSSCWWLCVLVPRGRDPRNWAKGSRPLGTRMVVMEFPVCGNILNISFHLYFLCIFRHVTSQQSDLVDISQR